MAGQEWGTQNLGGYFAMPKLSKEVRRVATPEYRFRQFVRPVKGFGAHQGDTVNFNRVANLAPGDRKLTEWTDTPLGQFTVSRGSVVVDEYGYGVRWTGKLEQLSELSVRDECVLALKNDMRATLDKLAADAFKSTKIKYAPTGTSSQPTGTLDTDGTQTTAATRHLQAFDLKEIREYMKGTLLVPPYKDDDYIMIAPPSVIRALMDDQEVKDALLYGSPEKIFNGELGRFYGIRIVEATGNLSPLINSTDPKYKGEAVIFGADPVVEAVVVPEEIRPDLPQDGGRVKKLLWYYLGGFAATFDTANVGEARIVHITGA